MIATFITCPFYFSVSARVAARQPNSGRNGRSPLPFTQVADFVGEKL
jgi:hypothetical protein